MRSYDTGKRYRWDRTLQTRFEEKFEQRSLGQCWPWTAGTNDKGYGQFHIRRKKTGAHQIQFYLYNGYVPEVVMHTCDNPLCVNPKHLKAGNHATNHADRNAKGRQARGESSGRAALTENEVLEVFHSSEHYLDAAARLNVSGTAIRDIRTGRRWGWLTQQAA